MTNYKRILALIAVVAMMATACSSGTAVSTSESGSSESGSSEGADSGLDAAEPEGEDSAAETTDETAGSADEQEAADSEATEPEGPVVIERGDPVDYGESPEVPTGDLDPELIALVDTVFGDSFGQAQFEGAEYSALRDIGQSGDVRLAWLMSDLIRFAGGDLGGAAAGSAGALMGISPDTFNPWDDITNRLIAWDIPAPPGYVDWKANIFTAVQPEWEPFFEDGSAVDYRHLSWGGVRIDDRPFDQTDEQCNCIPAADNPTVTDVAGADWIDDDDVVFGVEINGEARAYPRQIMEVREMVNDTLGGRDFGMPYCTLCGSAQVYFTDQLPAGVERPVLRTSGLLSRSNKFMYDLTTFSAFDTFTGAALAGPLFEKGIVLEQASVVTTTWAKWSAAKPDTTVLTEDLALGRDFDFRNNRDADGPIFPVGNVDPRLAVQTDVLGAIGASGQPIAFHSQAARAALRDGEEVSYDGVTLELVGGGLRAVDADGNDLGGHEAFWFAWSQFYPDTELWPEA